MTPLESGTIPSEREMQVVRLVAKGMTNPSIAAELGLSPLTVPSHLARVGAKFGTNNRAGLVGAAIRTGWLPVAVTGTPPAGFDEQPFDVLVRIARGRSNSQIGAELGLTTDMAKARVRRLLELLGASGREEAVALGVACGALRLVPTRRRVAVAA